MKNESPVTTVNRLSGSDLDGLGGQPPEFQERAEVRAPAFAQRLQIAVEDELVLRRRCDRVRQVDGENLEQPRRELPGVSDRTCVGHAGGLDDAQVEAGLEFAVRELVHVERRRRHAPHVVVDQPRPVLRVGSGAERADVPEAEGRARAIVHVIRVDRDVPADLRERPLDQPPEVVRLVGREVREVLVGSVGPLRAPEQLHRRRSLPFPRVACVCPFRGTPVRGLP